MTQQPTPAGPQIAFDPAAPHHQKPKLRPVRGFPVGVQNEKGEQGQMLGITDARQISDKMVVTVPAAQVIFPLMDGTRTIAEIVAQVGRGLTPEFMQTIVAQLDDAYLLEGPRFGELLQKVREDFDASENLPPASSAQFMDQLLPQDATDAMKLEQGPTKMREVFDQWMAKSLEKVEKPSFDQLPKAIMAPHLDYGRGWLNYANIWGRLRVCDRPDRVVILGTNHFGMGTGVVGCDKGFSTPLGVCEVDVALRDELRRELGDVLFAHRFDHENEHSIELQIPWIQHVFGEHNGKYPTVFGALVHDPAVNNGESYDGQGVGLDRFVSAMRSALAKLPGRTLVVSSADLSHAGPGFGDQTVLIGETQEAEEARNKVVQNDMQLLGMVVSNKPAELVGSMAWQQNPTRWCSTGNMVATLMITQPTSVELLNYAAAMDQQGYTMVSSAAMVMR
jgi:MEMO1 family protein